MASSLGTRISASFSKFIAQVRGLPASLKDPRRRRRVLLPALAAVVVIGGGLAYYEAVYRPAHSTQQAALQTTVARRGDLVISASGTGALQASNQVDLAFKTAGRLAQLNVRVGDQVHEGDVLAELDNNSQQLSLDQARQTLAGLTSAAAIASSQQSIAQATLDLQSAQTHLQYMIGPAVYYWENQVAADQQAVKDAQNAANAAPNDTAAASNLKKAQDALAAAQSRLVGAQADYEKNYVPNTFTVHTVDRMTHQVSKYVSPPSAAEILKARSAVAVAEGALTDSQNLYTALTGGSLPPNASGSGLAALQQARLALQTAQDNLQATQLVAPFSGTVVSLSAQVGDPVGTSSLLTLADLSHLFLQTYVDESDYSLFKVGNSASIAFDALPDQTFTGKVVQVSPALDTSSGSSVVSGLVQLDPTSADLLIGMGASVDIIAGQAHNAVLAPLAALHEYSPGHYAVFVLRNGQLQVRFVEVGLKDLVSAEIKSGLQPGDVLSTGLAGTRQQ